MNLIDMGALDYFKSGDGSFDAIAKKIDALYPCLKSFLRICEEVYTNCIDNVMKSWHRIWPNSF